MKTIKEIRGQIKKLEDICQNSSDRIPDARWLKPLKKYFVDFSKTLGETGKSLDKSMVLFDSLDQEKYDHTIQAFDNTKRSLEEMGTAVEEINNTVVYIILLVAFLAVTICTYIFLRALVDFRACAPVPAATDAE